MSPSNGVPFLDLVSPHRELEDELAGAVMSILRSAAFVGGSAVERFEEEYAAFCGVPHCVGVGSGTDALRFALTATGVGDGDVVVTVPNTFAATVEAIIQVGATPRFVDADPETFNMSSVALAQYLTEECDRTVNGLIDRRTQRPVRSIVPVHLYGQMCDMNAIMALAEEYGLRVVEDACQAHGSAYMSREGFWKRAGAVSAAAAFSFYPGKNLGACGEAGAVTTSDEKVAARARMLRDHGQSRKYHHQIVGYNGRLDGIQAAVLRVKLAHLERWNTARREAARRYDAWFTETDHVRVIAEPAWSRGVYHLYVVCVPYRNQLQDSLSDSGIGTGLHYPVPLHLQEAYAHLGYREGDFPVAEDQARKLLSLPMYPQLRAEQQERVAQAILDFFSKQSVRESAFFEMRTRP